ncbi:MAG TPA: biosynthetic-type acetolactate synthase large subunit [Candidatus Acidoferrales bacterium]|nr:biosynthetic-type acetolactate synthase large subunit [Candidatus Acidoferrales bacterium]
MSSNELTGAEIFVKCLMEENVEYIFGYPGGAVIGVYDAMHDMSHIQHILTRHEQGAVHAAEGYAKATGNVGVVLVTSGPGATNTVTGIADAYMDSVPIVVFTGQVATHLIGNDAFQEADIIGITRSITKHNFLVKDVRELAWTIKAAFHIASTGKPGPVVVDMPKDVMASRTAFNYPKEVKLRGYHPFYFGHMGQINKAVEIINSSKKPVLYVGGGVVNSNASKELYNLAKKLNAPVAMTLMGLGAFPADDELSMGMLGMHGTWYSNTAVDQCDCLIAIGARFDDRVTGNPKTFSPNSQKIHIDIDPSAIAKNVKVDVPIVGDVRHVLERLIPLVQPLDTKGWLNQIKEWAVEHPLRYENGDQIRAQYVIEKIYELTNGDAIVTSDVGQNQMWTAQFYKFKNSRSNITSGGLGTMGFSFPAAIGAAFGVKDRPIVSISGDGGFQMNIQELTTAVGNKLPIKIIILDNGYLGMVRQWQDMFYKKRYSHVSLGTNPDFAKIADAFGAKGFITYKTDEVVPILKEAFKINDRPVLIDFKTMEEDNVFPMIPAGTSVTQMVDYPKSVKELKLAKSQAEAVK